MTLSWEVLDLCSLHAFFMQQVRRKMRNILKMGLGLSFCSFLVQQPLHKSHPAQHFPIVFALLPLQHGGKPMYWSWWIQTFFLEIFYWGLSLDVHAGVSLTATALQAELCVHAVVLGTCWTHWVPGGVLCKEQSQITAAAAQRGLRPAKSVCWDLGAF